MKQKEQYTFEELCEGLEMSMSAFCKRAEVDEGTIARMRKGFSARNSTVNKLLRNFSEVYGIPLSRDNVLPWAKRQVLAQEQAPSPSILPVPIDAMPQTEVAQKRTVEPKRAYNRRKESGLPEGCVLATDFAKAHGVEPRTFYDHMLIGLGPGTVPGEETHPTLPVKEQVDYSERDKPGRKGERERYLTPAQQKATLEFWRRHGVPFKMPETEQEAKQEEAWYLPD